MRWSVVRARDIMTRPVITVRSTTRVREAIALLTDYRFNSLPVLDERGVVTGIFSESYGLRAQTAGLGEQDGRVGSVMSTDVEVIGPDAGLPAIADRMLAQRVRCLTVVEEGRLVGVVCRQDLLRTLVRDDDRIEVKVRGLLDDYAGYRRWDVEVSKGRVRISGEFADEAERRLVTALAATVAARQEAAAKRSPTST